MSFGSGIGDFIAVIDLVYRVQSDFKAAPERFQSIKAQLDSLSIVLDNAQQVDLQNSISGPQRQDLARILAKCKDNLQQAEKLLQAWKGAETKGQGIRKTSRRIWQRLTFKPNHVRELHDRISRNLIELNNFMTSTLVHHGNQQRRREILDWLTPINYVKQHSDILSLRHEQTGEWLLDSTECKQWISTRNQTLFCPGMPGAGKTILASIVVQHLLKSFGDIDSIAICYIFCNFRSNSQSHEDLLRSLLRQLAERSVSLPRPIMDLYDGHQAKRTQPSVDDIRSEIISIADSYSKVFVVVDALDECSVLNHCQSEFISSLLDFTDKLGWNLLATSRHIPDITRRFSLSVVKEIRAKKEDIGQFVEDTMSRHPTSVTRQMASQEIKEVQHKIVEVVDGMFLLATLHLNSLQNKTTLFAFRAYIAKLATGDVGYDAAYDDAMLRIEDQDTEPKNLAITALLWIVYAKRPLTVAELQHALGTRIGTTAFDDTNSPNIEDVVKYCCGLVTVEKQTGIVRLIHLATHEYLVKQQKHWLALDYQRHLTDTCVTYLSFDVFSHGRCRSDSDFEARISKYQLYRYASRHWGDHARLVANYSWRGTFLEQQRQVDAAAQGLLAKNQEGAGYSTKVLKDLTGLHLASWFGVEHAIEFLRSTGDLDLRDGHGRTPLSYAAQQGHGTVVQLLLSHTVNVNSSDKYGRTPLSYAAQWGHEAVVQLLLSHGADVNSTNRCGGTSPLAYAVAGGMETVVRTLLEYRPQVVLHPQSGWQPVYYASLYQRESIMRLLLRYWSQVESTDSLHQTPLSHTFHRTEDSVLHHILQHQQDLELTERNGQLLPYSPTLHMRQIQDLMNRRLPVELEGQFRQSPLLHAVVCGKNDVLRFLLEYEEALYTKESSSSRPLLDMAVPELDGCASKQLFIKLRRSEVDVLDTEKQTTLSSHPRPEHEQEAGIRFLLEYQSDCYLDAGLKPLSCLIVYGLENVVRSLLQQ